MDFYYLMIYHTFGLVWGLHWLSGYTAMVAAGVVAPAYWSSDDPRWECIPYDIPL